MQLEIEREALKKEIRCGLQGAAREGRTGDRRARAALGELTARWRAEKEKLGAVQRLQEQLDQARNELETAQRRGDLQRAGELLYSVIPSSRGNCGNA